MCLHADYSQSPSCLSYVWKQFPGLFQDWGEAAQSLVPWILLLAFLEGRIGICFLPNPKNLPWSPQTFKDNWKKPHSDISQLPQHFLVYPIRSQWFAYVQFCLNVPQLDLLLQTSPLVSGVQDYWRQILPVKIKANKALNALTCSMPFVIRSSAPFNSRLTFSLTFLLLLR